MDFYIINTVKANIFYIYLIMDKEIATYESYEKVEIVLDLQYPVWIPTLPLPYKKEKFLFFSEY